MLIATLMNSLSRKGTRTSTPHADVALFARKQSYWCNALTYNSTCKHPIEHIKTIKTLKKKTKLQQYTKYLATSFLMEFFLVRCLVEVQIPTKEFVRAFPRNDHFYPEGFYLSWHKKHRRASSNCRYIIGFYMVYHILYCINTILSRY